MLYLLLFATILPTGPNASLAARVSTLRAKISVGMPFEEVRPITGSGTFLHFDPSKSSVSLTVYVTAQEGRTSISIPLDLTIGYDGRIRAIEDGQVLRVQHISRAEYDALRVGQLRSTIIRLLGEPEPPSRDQAAHYTLRPCDSSDGQDYWVTLAFQNGRLKSKLLVTR